MSASRKVSFIFRRNYQNLCLLRIIAAGRSKYCHTSAQAQSNEVGNQNLSQKKDNQVYFRSLLYQLHPGLKDASYSALEHLEQEESDKLHVPKSAAEPNTKSTLLDEANPVMTSPPTKQCQHPKKSKRFQKDKDGNNFLNKYTSHAQKQNIIDEDEDLEKAFKADSKGLSNRGTSKIDLEKFYRVTRDDVGKAEHGFSFKKPVISTSQIETDGGNMSAEENLFKHNLSQSLDSSNVDHADETFVPSEVEVMDYSEDSSENEENSPHDVAPAPFSKSIPEFIDDVAPVLESTFNFAAYINRSESLQQLVKLGVDLSRVEKKYGTLSFILKLDFERDMYPYIQFLHDVGVPAEELGRFLTVNPMFFKETLDDLQIRIKYLKYKRFNKDAIARIVSKAPFFLTFSTVQIDARLGIFQKMFSLKGQEVRDLVTRMPKVVISSLQHIREITFTVKEEMGFTPEETKSLLLNKPKLWMLQRKNLFQRFDLLHNEMGIPHQLIVAFPGVLCRRQFLVKQRHLYLKKLQRAQYDPKQPEYVSLKDLVSGSDAEFCEKIKTSVEDFNVFLKTL